MRHQNTQHYSRHQTSYLVTNLDNHNLTKPTTVQQSKHDCVSQTRQDTIS